MTDSVVLEIAEGVGTVRLNRPESLNSLDTPTKEALRDTLQSLAEDTAVRAVVLTGSGKGFCVGQDIRELVDQMATMSPEELFETVPRHYAPICLALATMPKPVIAAVNGACAGAGASMAFACDFRIVSDAAKFNLAFTGIGLSPDTGVSWTLPRLVGRAKATELLMMPETFSADTALELGLATKVVPAPDLEEEVRAFAGRLADGPTLAFAAVRELLEYGATHTLAESLQREGERIAAMGATQDHQDAVVSFLRKEPPVFRGR